jgi:hypothetical protein
MPPATCCTTGAASGGSIELIRDAVEDVDSLRRLPCERLYQGP